jgi:hypothetical protein
MLLQGLLTSLGGSMWVDSCICPAWQVTCAAACDLAREMLGSSERIVDITLMADTFAGVFLRECRDVFAWVTGWRGDERPAASRMVQSCLYVDLGE